MSTPARADLAEISPKPRQSRKRPPPGPPTPARPQFLTRGPRVARFIEDHCVHGEGDQYGSPFRLRPWQRAIVNRLFMLEYDERRRVWRRRYRRALIGFPKGQGKTELLAALGLYMLLGNEHRSPIIPVAAASKQQAGLLFGAARIMCQESKTLRAVTETGVDEITIRGAPGRLYRVAAAEGTNDGQRPSAFFADELHEWRETRNTYTILSNGTAKRLDSLQVAISTAGHDLDTICGRLYQHGKQVESGEIADPEFYFHWLEPGTGADLDDPETWRAVNPAADDFWPFDNLRARNEDMVRKGELYQFRRYFLNQWTAADVAWITGAQWAELRVAPYELTADVPTWIGWDAASKHDSTAVVAVQWRLIANAAGELEERLVTRARIWERPIDPVTAKPVEDWLLPIDEVTDYIHELTAALDVRAIAYDPAFISWESAKLKSGGLPMLEFPQHTARLTVASQTLYELAIQGLLAHDGDPALTRHIGNAVAKQARTGGAAWRLAKGDAKRKMDAAIALAMAAWASQNAEEPKAKPRAPRLYILGDEDDEDDEE